jgi:RND family efflux transporter MFP subunit
MTHKRLWMAAALALAVSAIATTSLWIHPSSEAHASGAGVALPVEVLSVRHDAFYAVHEQFAGRVVSRRSSSMGFERSGTLVRVHFDEGDRVEAGSVLAELDTRALVAQRGEIDAQAAEIGAQLELARRTSLRRRKLHESEHLSSQQLDEAIYAERALAAKLAAVRASGDRVDVSLELSRIVAPYAGSIDARFKDEGSVVAPGEPLFELLEDGALEVRIGVPPATAAALQAGDAYPVEVDGTRVEAVLDVVLESVAPDTRTVTAIFGVPDAVDLPRGLRHGALARIALPREVASPGFWLPLGALAESHRGLWSAYVVTSGQGGREVVERRQLEVLHTDSDRAFVRGTLREGEIVVASGLHRLAPGIQVQVAASQDPASDTRTAATR